jgi:hypothetical protein
MEDQSDARPLPTQNSITQKDKGAFGSFKTKSFHVAVTADRSVVRQTSRMFSYFTLYQFYLFQFMYLLLTLSIINDLGSLQRINHQSTKQAIQSPV